MLSRVWRGVMLTCLAVAQASAVAAAPRLEGADAYNAENVTVVDQAGLFNGKQIAADGDLLAVAAISSDERLRDLGSDSVMLYRITRDGVRELASYRCPMVNQGDMSLWNGYLIIGTSKGGPNMPAAMALDPACDRWQESGFRIIDVGDPKRPREVSFFPTSCLYNHTLIPKGSDLFIYGMKCGEAEGTPEENLGRIKIFRFDEATAKISFVSKPLLDGSPTCRDITYFAARDVIACAAEGGLGTSALYDVRDVANPRLLATLPAPPVKSGPPVEDPTAATVATQAQFTWDGSYVAIVDRATTNAGVGTCTGSSSPLGDLFFWDISDLRDPKYAGRFTVEDRIPTVNWFMQCTPYRFNVLPMKDPRRYVAVVSWQNQGMSVVDFSDPSAAKEIAYFHPTDGIIQTAYWYNGRAYASDYAAPAHNGLWVLDVKGLDRKNVRFFRGPFNATTQVRSFR